MTNFKEYWSATDRFIDHATQVLKDWETLSTTIKGETP